MRSIHARDIGMGRTNHFLLNQLWQVLNPTAVPLCLAGLWFVFARPEGKRWRMLGWMYVLTLAAFLVARGRDYYLAPAYPMLLAAGAVWGEKGLRFPPSVGLASWSECGGPSRSAAWLSPRSFSLLRVSIPHGGACKTQQGFSTTCRSGGPSSQPPSLTSGTP